MSFLCGAVVAVGTSIDIHTTHPPVTLRVEVLPGTDYFENWEMFDFLVAGERRLRSPELAISGAGHHAKGRVIMGGPGSVTWTTPARGVPAVRLRTATTAPVKVYCNGAEKAFPTLVSGPVVEELLWCPIASTRLATLIAILILVGEAVTVALLVFILWSLLNTHDMDIHDVTPEITRRRAASNTFLIFLVPLMFYFAAFFPGTMSSDSLHQWKQALGLRPLDNAHPVTHTMLVRAAASIWESPASFISLQIITLCGSLAGLGLIARYGSRSSSALPYVALALACYPPLGFFAVAMWKDVIFSAGCLLFVVAIATVAIDHRLAGSWKWRLGFCFSGLSVLLFRHNGISTVLFGMAVLVYVLRAHRRLMVTLSVAMITGGYATSTMLVHFLDAAPSPAYAVYARPMQDIAAALRAGLHLDTTDTAALEKIAPLSVWTDAFVPSTAGGLLFAPNFDRYAVDEVSGDLRRIWLTALVHKPLAVLDVELQMLSLFWQTIPPPHGYTETVPRGIDANNLDLKTEPLVEPAHRALTSLLEWSQQRSIVWLFWRPVIWLLVLMTCFAATSLQSRSVALASAAPMVGHLAGMVPTLPAQDARYFLPVLLCLPVYVLLALLNTRDFEVRQWHSE